MKTSLLRVACLLLCAACASPGTHRPPPAGSGVDGPRACGELAAPPQDVAYESPAPHSPPDSPPPNDPATSGEHASEPASSDQFRFTTIRAWGFRDFLPENDHTDVLGLEFNSAWGIGGLDFTNISYFEVASYPRAIPGRPVGNPSSPEDFESADGITDLLTAFLVSPKREHHGPHHFAYGVAAQFPTASDESLGSGKWSVGPAIEYEYESGPFFAAFVALQLWSVAGDDTRKDVNMLMIKPMITYEIGERWKLVYMPYGISQYWNKPSGQQLYLPIGGGVQYGFDVAGVEMGTSAQFFHYAVRPDAGSENEIRLMLEFDF